MASPLFPLGPISTIPHPSDDDDEEDLNPDEGPFQGVSGKVVPSLSPAPTVIIPPPPPSDPDSDDSDDGSLTRPSIPRPHPPSDDVEDAGPPQVTAPVRKAPPRFTPKPVPKEETKPVPKKPEPSPRGRDIAAPVRTREDTKPRMGGAPKRTLDRQDGKPGDHQFQLPQDERPPGRPRAPVSTREYFMRRSSTVSSMRKSSAVNQLVLERTTAAPPVEVIVVLSAQDRVALTELERAAGKLDFLPLIISGDGPEPNYRWTVKLADDEEGQFGPFLDPTTKPAFTRREKVLPLPPAELEEIVDVKSFSKRSTRVEVPEPNIIEFEIDLGIEAMYEETKEPEKVVLLGAPPVGLEMKHPRDRRERVRVRPVFKLVNSSAIELFDGGADDDGDGDGAAAAGGGGGGEQGGEKQGDEEEEEDGEG